ncbi:MAG: sporulation integral membrane protein YlbJ [Clostridiales bacterium]|nr:sporulation integral membrane protein YlbJ [Clostridiales bacterium]
MKKNNISGFISPFIFLALAICIIIYPKTAFTSSLDGLNLWYSTVCPALLPFFICVEILIGLGVINLIGDVFQPIMNFLFNIPGEGAFAFIMSIASGYPVGAKVIADLRKKDICTKIECQRMINLCSTSGPLFVIGAVSIGMLKNSYIASTLLFSHYLSAISMGFLMRFYKRDIKSRKVYRRHPFTAFSKRIKENTKPLGQVLADSIVNSINLILMVGGYIIIFSVFSGIILQTGLLSIIADPINMLLPKTKIRSDIFAAFFIGILEVTNGVKASAPLGIPYIAKLALVSFFIGFGGISINAQVIGLIHDTDIDFSLYLFIKIFQGIIASFYSILFFHFSIFVPVFSDNTLKPFSNSLLPSYVFKISIAFLTASLFFFTLSVLLKITSKESSM